ncbi:S-layer protein [Aeromonas dhakensis]|uniref:VapA family S-layer protein n=1 Tax=Aeromonas dhakensis TaxID=196024 RepID=UPI0011170759|nr:S-layer protein [Aeromonas dhakensis]MDD9209920.1 S-layer protein [Aeromonas dhakensis]TNI17141.1 S-layer protein [Aeromonas dhakensis]
MFKKTLLAAAIVASVSAPAFAKVNFDFTNAAWDNPTILATVTKQTVLNLTSAASGQDLLMTVDNPAAPNKELRNDGALVIRINGDASFNTSEVRQWLSNAADGGDFSNVLVDASGAAAAVGTNAEVKKFFKLTSDGQKETLDFTIDENGKRLRIALASNIEADVVTNAKINLLLSKATNAFSLVKGSLSTVTLDVGVIQNASYTSDPIATKPLFKMDKLFALESVDQGKAVALVSEKFLKYATPTGTVATDVDVLANAKLKNLTSNQNIQKAQVQLTIEGDFSAFSQDSSGYLLKKDGTSTGWKVTGNVAARDLGASGVVAGLGEEAIPAALYVKPTNTVGIEAQRLTLKAVQDGSSATFDTFEDTLADLFIITRDGMKFDTITTGTTSANTIHIRDISETLPASGGKIYVTIVQYGEHGVNGKADGEVLVKRAVLNTTLPSGGAVSLKPSEVAAEVGAQIVAGRQARFVFEVETNRGEVAVKKSNAEGVDIQNGTKGVQGEIVDFTL